MWIEGVAFFLAVSLLFYCLFAGADFGAGILEAFRGRNHREEQRAIITHAISPVWEANHVWIILAVVILFVGFPSAYSQLSVSFHIPLTLMLLGIVLRGCAFTFRHYDAVKDRSQRVYSAIFIVSSLTTPFMLGTIAGGLFLGRAPDSPDVFYESYVAPWANAFSFAVGVFNSVLCAFLAAVYLMGETADPTLKRIFRNRAKTFNVLAIFSGAWVFVSAQISELPLFSLFVSDPFAIGCMGIATALLIPLWKALRNNHIHVSRLFVASQVGLILLGWFKLQYPVLVFSKTLYNSAAPEPTLRFLLGALLVGSVLIFPALFFLFLVFKRDPR